MKPSSQRRIREGVIRRVLYLNDLFLLPIRINTGFLAVTRAAKAQLRVLDKKPFLEGEGRKSYENREGFPRYSRRIHAIFTPSPPPEQGYGGGFVHSGLGSYSQRYKPALITILSTLALVITLCGCGKWNTNNPMIPISTTLTVGSVFTLPGEVQAMAAKDNRLYVCIRPPSPDSAKKLFYVVDASDPMNPQVIGSALDHGQFGYVYDLALFGSYAYVDTYLKGLVVLDISNPAAPSVLATYDTLATIPKGISGSHLYGIGYGLDYLSLSDPVHPKREGRLTNASVSDLVVPWDETRCAFFSYETHQICMAEFTIPTSPKIVAHSSPTYYFDGMAFCTGSFFGMTVLRSPVALRFSWNGGDSIREQGRANLPGDGRCLTSLGDRLVVGVTKSSFVQNLFMLATSGPQSPYVVGECILPFDPEQLTAEGNRIYADLGDGNLVVVEVTEH